MKKNMFFLVAFMLSLAFVSFAEASDYAMVRATLMNQDPDPAEPGKSLELRWKVIKVGNAKLENVTFELDAAYPFSMDPSNSAVKSVGTWSGYSEEDEYYTLYYKLRVADDALEGVYKIKLKTRFGASTTQEYDIRVGEKKEPRFVLGTMISSPTKLLPDTEDAELKIALENIGTGAAENVKMEIILPKGFTPSYSYSDVKSMGTIDSGQGESASFYIDLDENLSGGEHAAKVKISYKDENDDDSDYKSITIPFFIHVKSKPKFSLDSISTLPEKIHPGTSVELKLKLKNVGDKEGKSVSVRAFKESSQPFSFDEKSDFIGNLKPGETGEAVLKLTVNKDANPKNYLIDLEIRTIDGSEVMISDESIIFPVLDPKTESKAGLSDQKVILLAIGVLGLAVFALFGFYLGRKMATRK